MIVSLKKKLLLALLLCLHTGYGGSGIHHNNRRRTSHDALSNICTACSQYMDRESIPDICRPCLKKHWPTSHQKTHTVIGSSFNATNFDQSDLAPLPSSQFLSKEPFSVLEKFITKKFPQYGTKGKLNMALGLCHSVGQNFTVPYPITYNQWRKPDHSPMYLTHALQKECQEHGAELRGVFIAT